MQVVDESQFLCCSIAVIASTRCWWRPPSYCAPSHASTIIFASSRPTTREPKPARWCRYAAAKVARNKVRYKRPREFRQTCSPLSKYRRQCHKSKSRHQPLRQQRPVRLGWRNADNQYALTTRFLYQSLQRHAQLNVPLFHVLNETDMITAKCNLFHSSSPPAQNFTIKKHLWCKWIKNTQNRWNPPSRSVLQSYIWQRNSVKDTHYPATSII